MGSWTVVLSDIEEEAVLARTGDIQRELDNVVRVGLAATVANYQATALEQQKTEALAFKAGFDKHVDTKVKEEILATIAAASMMEEPLEKP